MADKPSSEPVLNLDTLTTDRVVTIDKKRYRLRAHEELSIKDYHRLPRIGTRMDVLMAKTELTDEEADELARALDIICHAILDAPEEVQARLTDVQRLLVGQAFLEPARKNRPAARAATGRPHPARSTGAKSSLNSSASTAAMRTAG